MKGLLKISLFFALGTVLLTGCSSEPQEKNTIRFASLEKKALADFPDERIESRTFIKFDSTDPEFLFNDVDNVKIQNGRVYLLFWHRHNDTRLLVFDMQGKGVMALARTGLGPEEYYQISDFDVDQSGNIHIIDGNRDELIVYGPEGNFISRKKLPYEVDDIRCLPSGDYLFVLCNWNTGRCAGRKVILAAPDLSVKKEYFRYGENLDLNFILSSNVFTGTTAGFAAFNESLNDNIYIFDQTGSLTDSLRIDFGSRTIPEDEKSDVEKNILRNEAYTCLSGHNTIVNDYVAGNMYSGHAFSYLIDRTNDIIYSDFNKKYADAFSLILGAADDGRIISYIRPEMFGQEKPTHIPDDVIEHVEDDNFALCITKLRAPKI